MEDENGLHTVAELANSAWFPYKESTIRQLIKSGELPVMRFSRRKLMIRNKDVCNFLTINRND